ncbi:hypothetical protein ABT142_29485 [Streptomyces sp. NPDC001857]|uniref:hypothetical protein n=1 Tax=unclassified Streptomyces TaxID=2593676 RepID=UPI00331753A1
MPKTPWAVLLCKFSNDNSEPYPRQRYQEIFTTDGAGRFNMVDYFRDMSHGNLDLYGSTVFGWLPLGQPTSAYTGSGPNPQGRQDLIDWARKAAMNNGVPLANYFSVVVVTNRRVDLFGGPHGAVCGGDSLPPSLLGQEMGHVYGLNHSRAEGSTQDYMDQWDVMSNATSNMAPHPFYTERDARGNALFYIGPGLNAANMWDRGWADLGRVWTAGKGEIGASVQLRPIHRHDLPGYLLARVGDYFVEFRVPEAWDAALAQPVILVHTMVDGVSYLQTGVSGNQGLTVGDTFRLGDPADTLGALLEVHVTDIDATGHTATISVKHQSNRHPKAGPAVVLDGVSDDAGGWVIVGGKVRHIPPRSPLTQMLHSIVSIEESGDLHSGAARDLIRREALQSISAQAGVQLARMQKFHSPAGPLPGR